MLDALFTSKNRVALLNLLLFAHEPLHLRDIARKLDKPPALVSKEMRKLASAGIVSKKQKGNLLLFEADRSNPAYGSLRQLFAQTVGFAGILRKELGKIKGIKVALVYGSTAEMNDRKTSDIDLLIIGETEEVEVIKIIAKVEKGLSREINYILWTEKEFKEKKERKLPLVEKILKGKILELKGDIHELGENA
ncbi:nucleotidyltransferase domain-containing protein [Candidatus Micrarchaeota archaeon]|nr:nucleotidyltransferase domain-containing protein [Candidatus Micrarchaeota archaeon]